MPTKWSSGDYTEMVAKAMRLSVQHRENAKKEDIYAVLRDMPEKVSHIWAFLEGMGVVGGSLPSPLNSQQTPSEDPPTPDQEVDHGATWRAPNKSFTRIDNVPLVHLRG